MGAKKGFFLIEKGQHSIDAITRKTTFFVLFEPTSLLTDPVCKRGRISVPYYWQYAIWFATFEKAIEKRMAAAYKLVIVIRAIRI